MTDEEDMNMVQGFIYILFTKITFKYNYLIKTTFKF